MDRTSGTWVQCTRRAVYPLQQAGYSEYFGNSEDPDEMSHNTCLISPGTALLAKIKTIIRDRNILK